MPWEFVTRVFETMETADWHEFQVLTKRADRLAEMAPDGPRARPLQAEWVRNIRDQCLRSGVPFFFKQWGGTRKKRAGRELDRRTWDEMPLAVVGH